MTTSQIPVRLIARARRRSNRVAAVALIKQRADRALTDFFYNHLGVTTLLATLAAGVMIAVAARVLLTLGGI